ncbi:anthranilate phosphoribosyltransferase [Alysiella filiformis]|uniref:Anthranilate phosphoribosyltransferase n=1 Tax=Alysiella filiformis DSM 16848 TaxID=1120981 RepID=A0A286EJG2_9NEIS|nr:anthranilate phosphoribosyltransferase [Alysiella filiformis]QMT30709.1 anthranilate phosphoribosyltransferase [Alysiella filiformis]UBQ56312.1 anthranilate phosphoribosyltransferase [Alysiella filiformis DSM 16848]SOD71062.1 anthranilate phosphoribosyltransferase [Alysiella filiformis DSM 16848]
MITPKQALAQLVDNKALHYDEMQDLMRQIMRGEVPPEQMAGILVGLRMKGETVSEIAAAASVMREFATQVPVQDTHNLVDIVGTGGDGAKTFNISTTAMFVAAAAGAKVAKHGGRSVSSSSGAADVLAHLGVDLNVSPQQIAQQIAQCGLGFMFAQNHHSAMRHVAPVRQALGFRTLFNILGPMTNPAAATNQLIGVFHVDLCETLSRVLQQLGSEHALVVHGSDGLDEITVTGSTRIAELNNGVIHTYDFHPEEVGLPIYADLDALKVDNPSQSLAMMNAVLDNTAPPAARDIVLLNVAACLYAGNVAGSLKDGLALAQDALLSGKAKAKQQEFLQFKPA